MWILPFVFALGLQTAPKFVHERPDFEVALPSSEWVRREVGGGSGAGGIVTVVLAPVADLTTRCSILRQPVTFLRDGLTTRETQLQGTAGELYQRVRLGPAKLGARETTRLDYTIAGALTIEWAFRDGDAWVIFQIAAPAATWSDPAARAALDAMRDSFVWKGGSVAPPAPVDATPVAEVRERRRAASSEPPPPFEVTRHTIDVRIDPEARSLEVDDTLELRARVDGARQLTLYTSVVEVDDVTCDAPIEWKAGKAPQADTLTIDLKEPLKSGQTLAMSVHAASADYFLAVDQKLVEEVAVLGQVRPRSSYSSHVVWYPIDAHNDAAVDITFDVPAKYVALTGGELVESSEAGGRRTFRYVEPLRTRRLIPFGFAVGEYVSRAGRSEAGLELSAWGFAGEEKRLDQRVATLLQAAAAFEHAFGPLPWKQVRFVHVRPERKETGVSLPGMIVVSDGYFPDLDGVDLSDGDLSRRGALGLLVVADELSHQWNIYAAGFPNELGEGLSTYTNALFVEARHGHDAYLKTMRSVRDGWIGPAGAETEFAIANPAVYSNSRYRSVVFCKTPVVLHGLRRRLGDERFFAGLRRAFELRDPDVDGFERFERGFEEATRLDLRPFFDQWFFRAGFPTLEVGHEKSASGVRVTLRQTQTGEPYDLDVVLRIACEDGSSRDVSVTSNAREQSFDFALPSPPKEVTLDPEGTLPAR